MNPYLEKITNLANPNKYTKYYRLIIENALARPQDRKYLKEVFGYVESHHILPESFELGGEKTNGISFSLLLRSILLFIFAQRKCLTPY